jgi:hypothetical protein
MDVSKEEEESTHDVRNVGHMGTLSPVPAVQLPPCLLCCPRREEAEAKFDVRSVGHMGNFYANLLTSNVAFGTGDATKAPVPATAKEEAAAREVRALRASEAAQKLPRSCREAAQKLPRICLEAVQKLPRSCPEAAQKEEAAARELRAVACMVRLGQANGACTSVPACSIPRSAEDAVHVVMMMHLWGRLKRRLGTPL